MIKLGPTWKMAVILKKIKFPKNKKNGNPKKILILFFPFFGKLVNNLVNW